MNNVVDVEFLFTTKTAGAKNATTQAVENNSDIIIICGGDGSINEMVNGYFATKCTKEIVFGILPIGTGNDFAKSLNIKKEDKIDETILKAVNILLEKNYQFSEFNIDKIASKYILPSENTVDYGLMYIPAEAIFHNILFDLRDENMGEYARKKKVVLTSPNTIYLTLKTIEHWFRDTRISHQTQEILKRLDKIQQDSGKLMEDFRKLGSHLKNASSAYDSSEKRLSLFSSRVKKLTKIENNKKLK